MGRILTYEEYKLQEALSLSVAKKYRKLWNSETHSEVFGKAFRLYFPLGNGSKGYTKKEIQELERESSEIQKSKTYTDVEKFLNDNSFTVDDYTKGFCSKENDKREYRIGKIINKSGNKELLDAYNLDIQKYKNIDKFASKTKELLVVISRHPYDIAGMSTDRKWHSCMNLEDGENKKYVAEDIKNGGLIAYLIKSDDTNINEPKGRILIKKFEEQLNPKNILYLADPKIYDKKEEANIIGFRETVEAWLESWQKDKQGVYYLPSSLYDDGQRNFTTKGDFSIKDILKYVKLGFYDEVDDLVKNKSKKEILEIVEKLKTNTGNFFNVNTILGLIRCSHKFQIPEMWELFKKSKPSLYGVARLFQYNQYNFIPREELIKLYLSKKPDAYHLYEVIKTYEYMRSYPDIFDTFIDILKANEDKQPEHIAPLTMYDMLRYVPESHTDEIIDYYFSLKPDFSWVATLFAYNNDLQTEDFTDRMLELDFSKYEMESFIIRNKVAQTDKFVEAWLSKQDSEDEEFDEDERNLLASQCKFAKEYFKKHKISYSGTYTNN